MLAMTTLRHVMLNSDAISWKKHLFVTLDEPWTLESSCALLDGGDVDVEEVGPAFATQHGLRYVLSMGVVKDIAHNARRQQPGVSEEMLLRAFLYYFEHDAFADLSKV